MKKQNVSLKKLNPSKSNVAKLSTNIIVGGGTFLCITDNGCGPKKSVWPDICPATHGCPPATQACTVACDTFACQSFACQSIFCASHLTC